VGLAPAVGSCNPLADWLHGISAPPHERRFLAPEDASRVGFDLPEHLVDAAGRQIVVAVPAAVAIRPVQPPVVDAGAAAELRDRTLDHPVRLDCHRGQQPKMVTELPRTMALIRSWSRRGLGPGLGVLSALGEVGLLWFGASDHARRSVGQWWGRGRGDPGRRACHPWRKRGCRAVGGQQDSIDAVGPGF